MRRKRRMRMTRAGPTSRRRRWRTPRHVPPYGIRRPLSHRSSPSARECWLRAVVALLGRACRHRLGQAIDLGGVGDFGERLRAGGACAKPAAACCRSGADGPAGGWPTGRGRAPRTPRPAAGPAPGGDARRSTHTSAKKIPSTSSQAAERPSRPTAVRPASCSAPCGSPDSCGFSAGDRRGCLGATIPTARAAGATWADSSAGYADRRISTIVADRRSHGLRFRHF